MRAAALRIDGHQAFTPERIVHIARILLPGHAQERE
jgi:hypothetical protein